MDQLFLRRYSPPLRAPHTLPTTAPAWEMHAALAAMAVAIMVLLAWTAGRRRVLRRQSTLDAAAHSATLSSPSQSRRNLVILVNPRSGGGGGAALAAAATRLGVDSYALTREGVAAAITRIAALNGAAPPSIGAARLVVAGGDGTVSAVVHALLAAHGAVGVPIAVLPLGTGNDVARSIGSRAPHIDDLPAWLDAAARGPVKILDAFAVRFDARRVRAVRGAREVVLQRGRVSRISLAYVSAGLDARVVYDVEAHRARTACANRVLYAGAGAIHSVLAPAMRLVASATCATASVAGAMCGQNGCKLPCNFENWTCDAGRVQKVAMVSSPSLAAQVGLTVVSAAGCTICDGLCAAHQVRKSGCSNCCMNALLVAPQPVAISDAVQRVELDGVSVDFNRRPAGSSRTGGPLPPLQSLVVQICPSYGGGGNLWGVASGTALVLSPPSTSRGDVEEGSNGGSPALGNAAPAASVAAGVPVVRRVANFLGLLLYPAAEGWASQEADDGKFELVGAKSLLQEGAAVGLRAIVPRGMRAPLGGITRLGQGSTLTVAFAAQSRAAPMAPSVAEKGVPVSNALPQTSRWPSPVKRHATEGIAASSHGSDGRSPVSMGVDAHGSMASYGGGGQAGAIARRRDGGRAAAAPTVQGMPLAGLGSVSKDKSLRRQLPELVQSKAGVSVADGLSVIGRGPGSLFGEVQTRDSATAFSDHDDDDDYADEPVGDDEFDDDDDAEAAGDPTFVQVDGEAYKVRRVACAHQLMRRINDTQISRLPNATADLWSTHVVRCLAGSRRLRCHDRQ